MTTGIARINTVKFTDDLELECLTLPDGSYGVGVSQIASVFSLPKNQATREIKVLLGEDFSLPKITTELHPKPVNYLTSAQFIKVCVRLAAKGNEIAKKIVLSHAEASMTSIVSYHFNKGISRKA